MCYFLSKVLKSRVDNYGKQFRDVDSFSKEIQKDPLIEDEKAKQIEDQAQDMINRWSALKYDLDGRIDRLVNTELLFIYQYGPGFCPGRFESISSKLVVF